MQIQKHKNANTSENQPALHHFGGGVAANSQVAQVIRGAGEGGATDFHFPLSL